MTIQAFVLRGPFTPEDMARFVALLREIDSGHPSKHYELVAVDTNLTGIETAAKLLKQAVPPAPGRETQFSAWPTDPDVWAKALGMVLDSRRMRSDPATVRKMVTDMFAIVSGWAEP
jgi:hypothetical protein